MPSRKALKPGPVEKPMKPSPLFGNRAVLGRLHEMVLAAVRAIGPDCVTKDVQTHLGTTFNHTVAFPAVFITLNRLEARSMVRQRTGKSQPRRGGRAPRLWSIEPLGEQALAEMRRISMALDAMTPSDMDVLPDDVAHTPQPA